MEILLHDIQRTIHPDFHSTILCVMYIFWWHFYFSGFIELVSVVVAWRYVKRSLVPYDKNISPKYYEMITYISVGTGSSCESSSCCSCYYILFDYSRCREPHLKIDDTLPRNWHIRDVWRRRMRQNNIHFKSNLQEVFTESINLTWKCQI